MVIVLCSAVQCSTVVLCCVVLCCAVLCCAVLCCAVLCCAVLCCAVYCWTDCTDSHIFWSINIQNLQTYYIPGPWKQDDGLRVRHLEEKVNSK